MAEVRPFANATEACWWLERNCEGCSQSEDPCCCPLHKEILVGFAMGTIDDATARCYGGIVDAEWVDLPPTCPHKREVTDESA